MEDPQTGMQAVGAGGDYPTIGGDAEENDADGDKGHSNDTAVTKGGGGETTDGAGESGRMRKGR